MLQITMAILCMTAFVSSTQAVNAKSERALAEKFLVSSGNTSVASRVVFYQSVAVMQTVTSLMNFNGQPITDSKFWDSFSPELRKMSSPHFVNVYEKLINFVQTNFTNEELVVLNKFFASGAGKKFGDLWTKSEFMEYYVNTPLANEMYAKALTYAKAKKNVTKSLSAEPKN